MTTSTAAMTGTPAWRLFADWCTATGRTPLPASVATISDFFDQVPASEDTLRRRLRVIRRAHNDAGHALHIGTGPTPTAWRRGPNWLPLGSAIARGDVGGGPPRRPDVGTAGTPPTFVVGTGGLRPSLRCVPRHPLHISTGTRNHLFAPKWRGSA